MLSPEEFKQSKLHFPPHGVAKTTAVKDALIEATGMSPPDSALQILCDHKVLIPMPLLPGEVFCPTHVRQKRKPGYWKKRDDQPVYRGIAMVSATDTPFSPTTMPHLQANAVEALSVPINADSRIWQRGFIYERPDNVSVMVR